MGPTAAALLYGLCQSSREAGTAGLTHMMPRVPGPETDQPDLMLERNFLDELPRVGLSFPASHAGTADGADGPHTAAAVMGVFQRRTLLLSRSRKTRK